MPLQMSEEQFLALGIEVQEEGFKVLDQNLSNIAQGAQTVAESVASINNVADAPLQKLSDRFTTTNKEIQATTDSLDELRKGLGNMPDFGGGGGPGEGRGFNTSNFQRAGRALGGLGLEGLGQPLQALDDILDVKEVLGEAGAALGVIGPAAEGATLGLGGMVSVIGPIAAIAVAAGVAVTAWNSAMSEHEKTIQNAIAQTDAYYAAIEKGTTESIQSQVKALQIKKDLDQRELNEVNTQLSTIKKGKDDAYNAAVASGSEAGRIPFLEDKIDPAIGALQKKAEDLQKSLDDSTNKLKGYEDALKSVDVATNDAAETEKALQNLRAREAEKSIAAAKEESQLKASGTTEGVHNRIKDVATEIEAVRKQIIQGGFSPEKISELSNRLSDLQEAEDRLTKNILPAVQVREAEEKAIKDNQKALDDITKSQDTYTKAVSDSKQQLDNQIETARIREGQAEKQAGPGGMEDVQAREKIRVDESRREIELAQDTANQLVDIRRREGQAETQVQRDLDRQLQDNVVNSNDQVAKLYRDAQRTQQINAEDHEQRLAEIHEQAHEDELDDISNRDFAKLAKDMQADKQQSSKEEQKYTQQEQRLVMHLQEQEDDLAISLSRQEDQQRLAAERRIEDLHINLDLEVQQVNIDEQRKRDVLRQSTQYQLDDLTTAENFKIQMLRAGLDNEIAMYQQAEQQRLEIAARTQAAIVQQAMGQIAQIGLSHPEIVVNDILQGIMGLFQS